MRLKDILNEKTEGGKVICDKCSWQWDISDGGKEPFKCHKCGNDNTPMNEREISGLENRIKKITKAAKEESSNSEALTSIPYGSGYAPVEEDNERIPRKKGQKADSTKHSDLFTDENPKGTIHGLKFATVEDAEKSVSKIKSSDKSHAHKIQAAVAMEQRAKSAGKPTAAGIYRTYINSIKKSEDAVSIDIEEDLRKWFKQKWVNIGKKKDGKHPPCGTSGEKSGYAKCVPAAKAAGMSKKEKESATRRKRAAQNDAGRGGKDSSGSGKKPINVSTKKNESTNPSDIIRDLDKVKSDLLKKVDILIAKKKKLYSNVDVESPMSTDEKKLNKDIADIFGEIQQLILQKRKAKNESKNEDMKTIEERLQLFLEKNCPTDPGKWSASKSAAKAKFDVYPSAYANGWASKNYKGKGGGWKKCAKKENIISNTTINEACWDGYQQIGTKNKGGRQVPNCVPIGEDINSDADVNYGYVEPEEYDVEDDDMENFITFMRAYGKTLNEGCQCLTEAEYQGREVKLGKPMQGDVKKFKVYVKNPAGNVVKVNFGQKGMKIRKDNPAARKSFRARMNCDSPGPRTKANYWSCRKW